MSSIKLIELLKKLVTLHQKLTELAERKTDILKQGDIDALTSHLQEEQKYILAIRQLDNERIGLIKNRLPNEQTSLSDYIEVSIEPDRTSLVELQKELLATVTNLQQVNNLNQQLIQQSMQFVNMTLDTIRPQAKTVNYGKSQAKQEHQQSRSMFDSQV